MTVEQALEAAGVRVRELVWVPEHPYHVARVLGGHYAIEVWDGGVDLRGTFINRACDTFEAAKAAAQADYRARILAALEVAK